jgi:hypothetical protein
MPASTGPATVAISDSEGVVSFALARKREEEMRRRRGHILFFSAWVALGVTAGLLVHFLVLHGVPLSFLRN